MERKSCVLYRDDGSCGYNFKPAVVNIFKLIPQEELDQLKMYVDMEENVWEGITRQWFKDFVRDILFSTEKIYTDSIVSISYDDIEYNVFIAIMKLFGIEIYSLETEGILEPDPLYLGEIQKLIKNEMSKNKICIRQATAEEKEEIYKMIFDMFDTLWLEYRRRGK